MIDDTIGKIEEKIKAAGTLSPERSRELLDLLTNLKSEVERLSATDRDQAQSIARFADISAHEATRSSRNPELLRISLTGLSSSVTGFEKSHPRLVQAVNAISNALSNLGI